VCTPESSTRLMNSVRPLTAFGSVWRLREQKRFAGRSKTRPTACGVPESHPEQTGYPGSEPCTSCESLRGVLLSYSSQSGPAKSPR